MTTDQTTAAPAAVADLREAAALLRQRAQAATPGTWSADADAAYADADLVPDGQGGEILPEGGPMEVAYCYRNEHTGERAANAAYIAALHPGVGLALADWLDESADAARCFQKARRHEAQFLPDHSHDRVIADMERRYAAPLKTARAYLGKTTPAEQAGAAS